MTGKIRTLHVEKGFGFITGDDRQDYFFHRSAIVGEGIENSREGDSVTFDPTQGEKVRVRRT